MAQAQFANYTARGPLHGALVVTRFPERFSGCDATIVSTAEEAMVLLKRPEQFVAVFADVGQLGTVNGYRFIGGLKKMTRAPVAYLMSDSITEYDALYAQRNGAKSLILRTLSEAASVLKNQPKRQDLDQSEIPNEVLDLNTQQMFQREIEGLRQCLQKYVGPAASTLVSRTLEAQLRRSQGEVSIEAMKKTLSNYIEDQTQRSRFLGEFK